MILGHRSSLELRFDAQRKEHEMMVKLVADLTKKLDAQGEKEKEKEKEKTSKPTGDEPCHPVDLTKDDDKDKDPEVGPSGSEQQALAIVPIYAIPMAEGESTHQEGGDTSGGDKGKSAADVLKDLSDDEILYLEPDYSKEAQIKALYNLEEGEIDSGDDWDEDDDVVIEIPKGDGEGEYEFEDGETFEVPSFDPSFESQLDTSSVETASNVEASTEAFPADPTPVDPEAQKDKDLPASSSKDPAPVWQKTSIIDKHGATGMILAVRFEEDKQLFAIKRSGGVQYLKPTSEAFNSLPRYDLVNLANRELLGHSNHAIAMGLWQKLVYKPVLCETKIPLSKLSQDILGNIWYWYVDPKTGEAVVIGKVLADRYCMHIDEWTKFLASKYDKVIKFFLDYKKKMEAKDSEL
ncbi:hypothetical protein L1987_23356 [Smallanthus sonchifolius]|uniref:Uncharacterized protein n=1 Tax=Smallanthus sonchifolius TaxID=185202 RepID=A0ACB9IGP5_9ASTR|nr:hypothetical protein L1987_23356 [Smallanthus sonchifolius]